MTSPRDHWPAASSRRGVPFRTEEVPGPARLAGDSPAAAREQRNRRFVGRRAELREISARAVSAAAGTWQSVVIEGRPGIGKTALLLRALEQLAGFAG